MRTLLITGFIGAILIIAAISAVLLQPQKSDQQEQATTNKTVGNDMATVTETKNTPPSGRYIDYVESEAANKSYDTTILFFHAPWCIECRGFEMTLNDSAIPPGVQILKTDYDSSRELRKKHDVTIQSTFVRVDSDGKKQVSWVGYGKDKTVDAIIQNTK